MTKDTYKGYYIVLTRNISDGLYSVKHWPVDGDEEEDSIGAGGYVSGDWALNRAKDKIDEHINDLQHLGGPT